MFMMPFPFMPNMNKNGEGEQKNACPFPFFGMPFPFMPNMTKSGEDGQQNACPFFGMPFPFMPNMTKSGEDGEPNDPVSMLFNMVQQWISNSQAQGAGAGSELPGQILQKLLQMEASPKNLERLQKVLDYLYGMYDKPEEK